MYFSCFSAPSLALRQLRTKGRGPERKKERKKKKKKEESVRGGKERCGCCWRLRADGEVGAGPLAIGASTRQDVGRAFLTRVADRRDLRRKNRKERRAWLALRAARTKA